MRRRSSLCAVGLSVAVIATVAGAFAPAAMASGNFTCRASAVRVASLFLNSEPVVANKANNPCTNDFATAVSTTGLVTANVPLAQTGVTPTAAASIASVASVAPVLGIVGVGAVNSAASVRCAGSPHPAPVFAGKSSVAALTIGGQPVVIGDQPVTIPLGIVNVYINEQVVTPNRIIQRGVRISSPLLGLDVVLAESIADVSGTPCG